MPLVEQLSGCQESYQEIIDDVPESMKNVLEFAAERWPEIQEQNFQRRVHDWGNDKSTYVVFSSGQLKVDPFLQLREGIDQVSFYLTFNEQPLMKNFNTKWNPPVAPKALLVYVRPQEPNRLCVLHRNAFNHAEMTVSGFYLREGVYLKSIRKC